MIKKTFLLKSLLSPPITVITLGAAAFLIIHPFSWSAPLNTSLLLLLNLLLVSSATHFKLNGFLASFFLSLLVTLSYSLRISAFAAGPIILLMLTSAICYYQKLNTVTLASKINSQIRGLEEETNILVAELEHLRLENTTLAQKLHRYTTLKGLTEAFSATMALDELLDLVTLETFRIVGVSNTCLLYLVDKEKQQLNLAAAKSSFKDEQILRKRGDLFDLSVFRQRSPLLVRDTKKDFRFAAEDNRRGARVVRSLIAAPLMREHKLLGILRLDNVAAEAYTADDLRLLDIISDLTAVAIENTMLFQETKRLAITDGLTGLFVHQYFQERLEQEITRALWQNSQFSFLMLDIDNFKRYNDRYGHIAGDIVLRKTAQLIRQGVGGGDIAARYGGEEFAVLLVDTSKKEALKVARRICEKVDTEKFILRRRPTEVTISGGLASFPQDAKVKKNLIQAADQALYRAKGKGKNRICSA